MKSKIYILKSPLEDYPKYIGFSCDIKKRFKEHLRDKSNTHKVKWISFLKKQGITPEIEIIDEVLTSEVFFWEMHYISLYRSWGFKLTNGTRGGDGVLGHIKGEMSDLTRFRLSESGKRNVKAVTEKNRLSGLYREQSIKMSGIFNPMKNPEISRMVHEKNSIIKRKPVVQFTKKDKIFIKEWSGIIDAANILKIQESSITKCCKKNGYKSAGGFYWEYKNCSNC